MNNQIKQIADQADLIVNDYAFCKKGDLIQIVNLNSLQDAAVVNEQSQIIETTMDDIEMNIVMDLYQRNKVFMSQ